MGKLKNMPEQKQIESDIIQILEESGGKVQRKEIIEKLANKWKLSDEEKKYKTPGGWTYYESRIDGVASNLKKKEKINTTSGVWSLPINIQKPPIEVILSHDKLQNIISELGKILSKTTEIGTGIHYRHDILWKDNPYKITPSHVWEICDKGNLDKDIAALTSATDPNIWGDKVKAILVTIHDSDYENAKRKLLGKPIKVVKASIMKQIFDITKEIETSFLKDIFE